MPLPLRGLRYYGGKSPAGPTGAGRWVASMLPRANTYIEPWSGMCGVLLQRRPAPVEVINDLSGDVVNWWRAVRDCPDEFDLLVQNTPASRAEFARALRELRERDVPKMPSSEMVFFEHGGEADLRRALNWHIVITQSVMHADGKVPHWGAATYTHATTGGRTPRIKELAHRMRYVIIHNIDAFELLDRVKDIPDSLVYCDPPYPGSDTGHYKISEPPDIGEMSELLLAQKGKVAVSGFGEVWDHLGWHRSEFTRYYMASGNIRRDDHEKKVSTRKEVLWTSFPPVERRLF